MRFSLALNCKVLPECSVIHYAMLHILASTYLLFNMVLGYQSFSALYSKRFAMGFISGEFSGQSRTGNPLHSMNVLTTFSVVV